MQVIQGCVSNECVNCFYMWETEDLESNHIVRLFIRKRNVKLISRQWFASVGRNKVIGIMTVRAKAESDIFSSSAFGSQFICSLNRIQFFINMRCIHTTCTHNNLMSRPESSCRTPDTDRISSNYYRFRSHRKTAAETGIHC